jgi:hypothetical protein
MSRITRVRAFILVVPAFLLFFFLALDSMTGDSPTMDEQNHLARGLAFLRTGDPRLSLEHPPLVNSLSALPLLTLTDVRLPIDHPSWDQPEGWYAFAEQLLWVYNDDVTRMIFLARMPIVFLTLGLALVGYHFARQFWGWPAAIIAFLFLLFDPNILAHGRYTTTDLGGALFLLLATLLLWRMWSSPGWSWGKVVLSGVGVGLAMGSKLSNLVFIPIFALLALMPLYDPAWSLRKAGRRLAQYLIAGLIGLGALWAIYGFQWQPFTFQSEALKGLNQISGPMPTFWAGIEQILTLTGGGRPTFLLGKFSTEGWWYYFPIALLVKTPLPVLLLVGLAAVLLIKGKGTRGRAVFLLIPAIIYFLISLQSALNIGYRHLLLILPFLYVLVSGLASLPRVDFSILNRRFDLWRVLLYSSVILIVAVDLLLHPHYLSYFNVVAGGPANGHNVLVDSNVDWGQDLLRLKEWMAENEVDQVKLAWFGTADPAYYNITYDPLPGLPRHFDLWWDLPFDPADPEPGVYAISASNLWELPLKEKTVFPWFREREPDDRIGYSINIYYVDG